MSSLTACCNALSFDRDNARSIAEGTLQAVTVQTGLAALLGGASLGSAIVTVGLPAGAVAILIGVINVFSVKLLREFKFLEVHRGSESISTHLEFLRRNAIWIVVGGITSLSPTFKIHTLVCMFISNVNLLFVTFRVGQHLPIQFIHTAQPWMDRLGMFVRA